MIKSGDYVRSYDFGKDRAPECYIEGVIESVGEIVREGCPRYSILVMKDVWEGVEVSYRETRTRVGRHVFPPLNGTPRSLGGVCNDVELLRS